MNTSDFPFEILIAHEIVRMHCEVVKHNTAAAAEKLLGFQLGAHVEFYVPSMLNWTYPRTLGGVTCIRRHERATERTFNLANVRIEHRNGVSIL